METVQRAVIEMGKNEKKDRNILYDTVTRRKFIIHLSKFVDYTDEIHHTFIKACRLS